MRCLVIVALTGACSIPSEQYTPTTGDASDAPPSSCWPIATTNFDPCPLDFPTMMPDFALERNLTLDTTQAKLIDTTGSQQPMMFGTLYNSTDSTVVLLAHVHSMTIGAGLTLKVTGMHPLLVVSDTTIVIDGTLDYTTTSAPEDGGCMTMMSTQHALAPGGTGGGFGGDGGKGGAGDGGTFGATMLDQQNGDAKLSPLRVGCAGAKGATSNGLSGGGAGSAGGAIELSAHDGVSITHIVSADGGGGGAGQSSDMTHDSGGGGGGSGGAVLLEAPTITLDGASLCAVGGGGGPGGVFDGTPTDGSAGVGCTAGSGGTGPLAPSGGGGSGIGNGIVGGTLVGTGGGGGGGACGRISLHGAVDETNAAEKPAAVRL